MPPELDPSADQGEIVLPLPLGLGLAADRLLGTIDAETGLHLPTNVDQILLGPHAPAEIGLVDLLLPLQIADRIAPHPLGAGVPVSLPLLAIAAEAAAEEDLLAADLEDITPPATTGDDFAYI